MKNKKVIVGLSGGVDSSFAVLELIKQGYDVECLFMRNWDSVLNNDILGNDELNSEVCSQEQDYIDAQKVSKQLNVKLHRVDFIKEYWDYVFEYFISEYKNGRTPNPDILCNKYIKFDKFLDYAINELGADYIAMGHYAGVRFNKKNDCFELYKAKDINKDQSYFLCQLNQYQLSKTLFPLCDFSKDNVRRISNENNLYTANKKDSTGVCFIGERNFTKFLQNYIPNSPGKIIDVNTKKVLGDHIGTMYYTIGQRKGLNLGGNKKPYYVSGKDIEKKIIYVSDNYGKNNLYSKECIVNEFNWIIPYNKYFDSDIIKCTAKFRYRQEDVDVVVKRNKDKLHISYDIAQRAITPGQWAVLYLGDVCLGGGIIDYII